MKTRYGQKLTEEEEKAYLPNLHLELTSKEEIKRLNKVIKEKDEAIQSFKRYDEERKSFYRRFEQNYQMMEERFNEFMDAINDCGDIDEGTKEFYNEVVKRLYKGKVNSDKNKSIFQKALSELNKLQDSINNMEFVVMTVGNPLKKGERLKELKKVNDRYSNIINSFQRKMSEFK